MVGPVEIPLAEFLNALRGQADPTTQTIVANLRLPRVILAAMVGGGLAVSGTVFQALLRNPLAEPYVLGVSSGAALGAVTAIVFGLTISSVVALPLAAFGGAVLAMFLVLFMAGGRGRGLDTRVLLLSGVVIAAFFNALLLLLINFADVETFRAALLWIMGSFAGASWEGVTTLSVYLVPAFLGLTLLARPLNLLSVGEQSAFHLGVDVRRFKLGLYLATSLVVGVCVAGAGAIGFVGLVVPHALRLIGGSDHRWLLPGSAVAGAFLMVVADTVARTIVAPVELPVGVVTALIGVPVFLWLLLRNEEIR
ncbi:MAG: iron ABC transporter permease [Gemmatimonadetes bacterium]|nr:iron ABC transporter permease [Gemmatimonadota bacterium]NNM03894.1 iron ABC transporter permease [Gemmatimonadota bacterium]